MAVLNERFLPTVPTGSNAAVETFTVNLTEFDQRHYVKLIRARGEMIRRVVTELRQELGLASAVDAGCGVGFFSQILQECGLSVRGFDGRTANIVEARQRFSGIPFEQGDIESVEILKLGAFDLTLCFGLLYHLENPMLAIRHLRALTGKGMLLESMCIPGNGAGMMLREEPSAADQSLTDIALYPTESCLVKMLYRAGFAAVYRIAELPDHDDFRGTAEHMRRRTVLFAAVTPAQVTGFAQIDEPHDGADPWSRIAPGSATLTLTLSQRLKRFALQPRKAKYFAMAARARRIFPNMPIALRLPFGAWWLAEKSALDHELMHGNFEDAEKRFVRKLLRPGMTVLDVGAHHGLYTLLAAKQVGWRGKVIAFEPSPRERRRLLRHLRVNACWNVAVEPCGLGAKPGETDLFVVEGWQDWCNSLRPPAVNEPTQRIRVDVERLDDVLWRLKVGVVDFIKLDVEGAELSVLEGAGELLQGPLRPVILTEVQDIRTRPWGYRAREIVDFLVDRNYCWFSLKADGRLQPAATDLDLYDANLAALPAERAEGISKMLAETERG
jgi:FkbM family methyltransferase